MSYAEIPGTLEDSEPAVLETYSLVYALVLVFLLPAMALMTRLPFGDARSTTYTLEYVLLITVPFILGIGLTFLLDSPEGIRKAMLRFAVLTPLIVVTGVTFMFGFSMIMIPASKLLGIREQGLSIMWWIGLAVVAAPLLITLVRRVRGGIRRSDLVPVATIILAIALVVGLTAFSFLVDANIYELVRKDVVIYVVGALSWYLPSMGLAAGLWRKSGLV